MLITIPIIINNVYRIYSDNNNRVHCTMYIIQCTLYSVYCIVYSVQCTLYCVYCTVYNIHGCIHCTLHFSIQWRQLWSVHWWAGILINNANSLSRTRWAYVICDCVIGDCVITAKIRPLVYSFLISLFYTNICLKHN